MYLGHSRALMKMYNEINVVMLTIQHSFLAHGSRSNFDFKPYYLRELHFIYDELSYSILDEFHKATETGKGLPRVIH